MITKFRGPYFYLSNFYPITIRINDEYYPSSEHAYQALKFLSSRDRDRIRECRTPGEAKRLARVMFTGWYSGYNKYSNMERVLREKFSHKHLRQMLVDTGHNVLIEGNTWGDKDWGCVLENGEWVGNNNLGKLLMKLREEYIKEDAVKTV